MNALVKTGDSTFDKIYAYYVDSEKYTLTEKQQQIRERWLSAWTLRLQFHSKTQAVEVLCDKFGYTRAQGFRDLQNAERLFGNVLKTQREGTLAILYEYSHKFFQMAIKAKDLKAMGKALELMGKYGDLDNGNDIDFNPEKLENKPVKFTIDKRVADAIIKKLAKGTLDFNDLDIEDIPHEEVE